MCSDLQPAQRTAIVIRQVRIETINMEVMPALYRVPPAPFILPALADGAEGCLQLGPMLSAEQTIHKDTRLSDVAAELPVQHPGTAAAVDHAQRATNHRVHCVNCKPREPCD